MLMVAVLAIGLTACGGGGSKTSSPPPSPSPPPTAPPPPPPPPPQPAPPIDVHLSLTNADAALAAGFTGAGIRVAVVDTGVRRDHPTLVGRVVENQIYVSASRNDLTVDDKVGHGTYVSQILAGRPFGQWPGGVAPGALIISARIINDAPPEDDGSGQGNEVGTSAGDFFAHLNGRLIASGARIMNNSWGGLYWESADVTRSFYDAFRPFVLDNDGLVVFATGNSSFDDPSNTAALPSKGAIAASLEQGWLAVGALDSNNPSQLASYSNACGVAMRYCLVAPGRVVVTGLDDTPDSPSYWVIAGTSLAAPQVSGAAALVWEAFPYFNNDLVRQTLLGTATDMGEPGPDPIFGYGLLNVGKAVRGPGRFDWGDVTASFSGISRWQNAIHGDGGLIKRGSGLLVLGDADGTRIQSSYSGRTRVEQGGLHLERATLSGSDVSVSNGAALWLSSAEVTGSVDNAGRVDLRSGDSEVGSFLQRAGATFGVRIGARLRVLGDMTIAGGDFQVLGTVPGYVSSSQERVVDIGGRLSGTFDDLTVADGVFFEGRLVYETDAIWLEIERISVSAAGLGLRGASVGAATRLDIAFSGLDAWLTQPDGDAGMQDFLEGAGRFQRAPDHALAQLSVESLSGELHVAQLTAALEGIGAGTRAVTQRVVQQLGGDAPPLMSRAWTHSFGVSSTAGTLGQTSGRLGLGGRMIGQDMQIGSQGLLGWTLSKSRMDAGLDALGGEGRSLVDEGSLYAGWGDGARYAHGRVMQGRLNQLLQRQVLLGTDVFGLSSQYTSRYTGLSIESGLVRQWNGFAVNPFVSGDWVRLSQGRFEETGAFGFGLSADPGSTEHSRAGAGVRLGRSWDGAHGARHGFDASLHWQRTLSGQLAGVDARFTGIDAYAPITGAGLPAERLLLGLDATSRPRAGEQLGLRVEHDLMQGSRGARVEMFYGRRF